MSPLRIGYDPDFAPITFRDAEGGAAGTAIGLLRSACAAADVDCDFVPAPQAVQRNLLFEGAIDALAAMGATAARGSEFSLSDSYLETGAAWFSRRRFDPVNAPPGTTVATPASGPLVSMIADRWPHLCVVATADYDEALAHAATGPVSAAALNIDVGRWKCEHGFPGLFEPPTEAFARIGLALAWLSDRHEPVLRRLSAALALDLRGPNTH